VNRIIIAFIVLLYIADVVAADTDKTWIADWREAAVLNVSRAGAAVLAFGDYMYAIGGVDGVDFLDSVEVAHIRPDGTLGPWRITSSLTEARGFLDAVAHENFLYAVGGGNGPNGEHLLRSVERAPIKSDGGLGPWERLTSHLTVPRRCVKLFVSGNLLYAVGGFGGTLLDTVERAEFGRDGQLGSFRLESDRLTMPRYVNAVKRIGKRIYVLGGHKEEEGIGIPDVEVALLRDDDTHGPWHAVRPLGLGRYALAAAGHGEFIYALGGLDGARYVDTVEISRASPDGSLSEWRLTTPLSSPRANPGVVVRGNRLYVVGGTNRDSGYFRSVEFADLNETGDLGFMGTALEARLARARRALERARAADSSPLPNSGIVRQVMQSGSYTYVSIDKGHGDYQWVAGPRLEVERGDRVAYSEGVEMDNFHSRTLDQDFFSILFVERLERVTPTARD
jgi:hypothetical protein